MAKRRLIKKINEVSDEELTQDVSFTSEPETEPIATNTNNQLIKEQEQEIKRLRELIEEYRLQDRDFEQNREENFRLSQQNKQLAYKIENNQDEIELLREKNSGLEIQLSEKEAAIFDLQEVKQLSSDSLSEINLLHAQINELKNSNEENQERIEFLELELVKKDEALEVAIQAKEKEIGALQEELTTRETIGEKQEALETVKMELESLNQQLSMTTKEKQELASEISVLQSKMQQLELENQRLKEKETEIISEQETSIDQNRLDELKKELEQTLREKSELEMNLGRIQGINDKYSIQKNVFESEIAVLKANYNDKETELEKAKAEIASMQTLSNEGGVKGDQLAELLQAKQQINDLLLKNQSLQEEALKSQQEIGEVMVSAKKEANRIISEAQVEAKHMINSAELEMLNIGNRAKNISNEVEESKNEVMTIYRELEERLGKLSRLDKN
ncbi:hypothetical protein ACYSNW_14805 [Enterococcus sp. LJL99]